VVTNEQVLLMIGIPMVFDAALFGIVIVFFEVKLGALSSRIGGVERGFELSGLVQRVPRA
jgi:hypothetical protein